MESATLNSSTAKTLTNAKALTSSGSPVMTTASQKMPAPATISGRICNEVSSARQSTGGAARPLERNRVTGLMLWACCSGR